MYHHQTRLESLLETVVNTGIGFVVSASAWPLVAWMYDYPYTLSANFSITAIFTGLSIARGYAVRRYCDYYLKRLVHNMSSWKIWRYYDNH